MAELLIIRGKSAKEPLKDNVSGLAVFMTAPPQSFVDEPIHKLGSLLDAERLGIVGDYSDETPPSDAIFALSGTPEIGDEVTVLINWAKLVSVIVDSNTQDLAALSQKIVDEINLKTYIHGFTASFDGTNITVTPRAGLGGLTVTLSVNAPVNITATISQNFTGGTVSQMKLLHYFIKRYFDYSDKELYLGIFTYGQFSDELIRMQNFAKGAISQFAVLVLPEVLSNSLATTFQQQINVLQDLKTPAVVTLTGDLKGLTFSTLQDLQQANARGVNVFIGNDGNYFLPAWNSVKTYKYGDTVTFLNGVYQAKYETTDSPLSGAWLYIADNPFAGLNGSYYGEITVFLALLSIAKVSENIGWIGKFNLQKDYFTRVAILGSQYEFLTEQTITELENKNYTFFRYYPAEEGVFISDTWTAISKNDDYATIENNRTFNKAVRVLAQQLNPFLNSPLLFKKDGTLKPQTLEFIKSEIEAAFIQMKGAQEISNYEVYIDENQKPLETGKLVVKIKIQPVGVARFIEATITFTTTI